MWASAGTMDYHAALQSKPGAKAITSWLLQKCGPERLAQFQLASKLHGASPEDGAPLECWW